MLKKSSLIFLLFIVWICSLAQDQQIADSLKTIYANQELSGIEKKRLIEEISYYETDPQVILEFALELISLAGDNPLHLSSGYLQKGNAFKYLGKFDQAFEAYFAALKYALESKESSNYSSGVTYSTIADAYSSIDEPTKSINYYNDGIGKLRQSSDLNAPIQLASALLNAGDEYLNQSNLDSALLYFQEASEIFDKEEYTIGKAYALGNMGLVYVEQGNFNLAEKNLFDATNILEELGDAYGISSYQTFMADVYLQTEYLMGALIHANIALENATKYDMKEQIRDASMKLSEIYEAMSKSGEAIHHLKTFIQYSDSLTNPRVISSIAQTRRKFEDDQKAKEVAYSESNEITDSRPVYYALIIGIDDYQFNEDDLVDLGQPVADATSLRKTLIESYTFEPENIIFLKNATRSKIINALEAISATITEKDNLLVFYAGHGVWDEKLEIGYWLPSDATMLSKANWLSNSRVRDYISGIKTKHTLLITDACFSGSIFKTRSVELSAEENTLQVEGFVKVYRLPSRKAMTSGTLTTVPDQSTFMRYLIRRLKENQKNYISARQVFTQVETAVINNSTNVPQYGTIQNAGDEGGDFIFIRKD